ncbi:MAG TPA: tyrosine-type recombinase/integrase [Acidimicrobiales bacterium]|nr:tyrosine-type recombinase/integrase [Acidimicrobiales bacterium]
MPGSLGGKRPGVWELRVFLGRDAAGKVRHRSHSFRGGKRDAQRALAHLVASAEEADGPVLLDWGLDTTVNDALAGWEANGWQDLSPTTVRRYRSIWDHHIRDGIGQRKIRSISPYDVEQFLRQLKDDGLSQGSVRYARCRTARACRLARKWSGNRLPNPVGDTELPEWALGEQPAQVRSPEVTEVQAILAAAEAYDLRVSAFVRTVAATGARRGEVCAIRWSDVDWQAGSVRIDEAVINAKGGAQVKGPKTRASIRLIALDAGTVDVLADLRADRERLAATCDVDLAPDGFVFATDPTGVAPPHPDGLSHAFVRVRRRAGVAADVHLHSLRHFQSTVLDSVITGPRSRPGWVGPRCRWHGTTRAP